MCVGSVGIHRVPEAMGDVGGRETWQARARGHREAAGDHGGWACWWWTGRWGHRPNDLNGASTRQVPNLTTLPAGWTGAAGVGAIAEQMSDFATSVADAVWDVEAGGGCFAVLLL